MIKWIIAEANAVSEFSQTATSSTEQAGAAIGTGLGVLSMFLAFWAFGDIVLGLPVLFTRPKD